MPPIGTILFGIALAIDGDTLSIDGERIRLQGIDAPDIEQQCERDGVRYACGADAAAYLAELLGRHRVICSIRAHEEAVAVASCEAAGRDIAAAMLDAGWAFAAPQSGRLNAAQEREARARKAGMWAGSAEPPWLWRMRRGEMVR